MNRYIFLLVAILLYGCDFKHYRVPTPGMVPNIPVGTSIYLSSWEFKRGDIIIFNRISNDQSNSWIIRAVGMPGDSFSVVSGEFFINGKKERRDFEVNRSYTVQTSIDLEHFFNKIKVEDYLPSNLGTERVYLVQCTPKQKEQIESLPEIDTIYQNLIPPNDTDDNLYFKFLRGNKHYLKEMRIPKEGDTLRALDYPLYSDLILEFEDVQLQNQEYYIVKKNYHFLSGDNRDNSLDSRYIGLIPRQNIKGRASVF